MLHLREPLEELKQMSKELYTTCKVFQNDDAFLTLAYPEEFEGVTELSEVEIKQRFLLFSRLFFNDIFTKQKKSLNLIQDERTGEWLILPQPKNK